jgi:hypothetical protein
VSLEQINEQNQARLANQLKTVNQCEEAREAIRLEVSIETMAIPEKLRRLTQEIDTLEKQAKSGQTGPETKSTVEKIKA